MLLLITDAVLNVWLGALSSFFFFFFSRDNRHTKQKKVNTAGRAGPKETDYRAQFVQLVTCC